MPEREASPRRSGAPSPRDLARFSDPAARVTAVDYTRTGAVRTPPSTPAAARPERFTLVPQQAPAPAHAALTIDASDPRPHSRPLQIVDHEVRTVSGASLAALTHELIVSTVADPEDMWSADGGASDHFRRGAWTVQVRRADNHVIGVFPSAYAEAVRPAGSMQGTETGTGAGPSVRRGRGTRHPADVRALKKRLEEHGFHVSSSGATHGKITHPDYPGLFTPWASSPSDRRHPQLVTAQVKRVFGIDIRA